MSKVILIKNLNQICLSSKWAEVDFKDKNSIIDENGLPVGKDLQGRHYYRLVAKRVRFFSKREMLFKNIFAGICIVFSFGAIYVLSSRFRKYVKKNKTSIRFALLVDPKKEPPLKKETSVLLRKPQKNERKLQKESIRHEGELSDISSLQIGLDHPISKSLSRDFFTNEEAEEGDMEFLRIPLKDFMYPEECKKCYEDLIKSMTLAKSAMQHRLENFEKSIQLQARMEKIGDCEFILNDFVAGWQDSPLKFGLALDEEFSRVTLKQIADVDSEFIERIIRKRLIRVAEKSQDRLNTSIVASAEVHDLCLIHIYHLDAKSINEWVESLPPIVFCLLSDSVIPDLSAKDIPEKSLNVFFRSSSRVHKLSTKQVNGCIDKVAPHLLIHLSDEQILALDFRAFNQAGFDILFNNSERAKRFLQSLNRHQIQTLKEFFAEHHWNLLTDEQISDLGYSDIAQEEFEMIFSGLRSIGLIHDLRRVREYLTTYHWKNLTERQIGSLDFSEIEPNVFKILFSDTSGYTLIPSLRDEQIQHAYPYFYSGHWKQLTSKQILHFDFFNNPIDEASFRAIFCSQEKLNLLGELPYSKVKVLCQYFRKEDWGRLSLDVLRQLDYENINQEIFQGIFSQQNSNFEERIQALRVEKLHVLFQYFLPGHWRALNEAQVLNLVNLDYAKITQEYFSHMFPIDSERTRRILPKLTRHQVFLKIHAFFEPQHIEMLQDKQKEWLIEKKECPFEPGSK